MKRYIWIVCLMMIVLSVVACTKWKSGKKTSPPPGQAVSGGAGISGGAISPGAVLPKEFELSDSQAFALAEEIVQDMTLEEKIGQMFLVDLSTLDASEKNNPTYNLPKKAREQLEKALPGGIYLSEKNIKTKEQTLELIDQLQGCATGCALYIAVEEEGGGEHSLSAKVNDLKVAGYIMPADLGGALSEEQIYNTAGSIAKELREWNVNLNLAPVADISSNMKSDYMRRCFSTDEQEVETALRSYVSGQRDQGLATTLKYFPGIGNVSGDYEEELLKNTDSLMKMRRRNFKPYKEGIEAGTDCIMVSNVAIPKITVDEKLPAFMSEAIVTDLLREEIGFDGIIMTPALTMKSLTDNYKQEKMVVESVKAGCDMIVLPDDYRKAYKALLNAVHLKVIDEKRINTSVSRIVKNKIQRGIYRLEPNK